jgi:NAD(P)-dependent dehydrogenase (short-subunit alcohol dehydrogenase family)
MSNAAQRTTPEFVLVSGAAGGIGSAIARRFTQDGARVAITDLDADRLKAVAAETGTLALPADGTQRDELRDVVAAAATEFGRLDAVIAAQGASAPGPANAKGDRAWAAALEINLNGAFYLATEAMPRLMESRGNIVMISSVAGVIAGPPGSVGYTAAKAGLIGLVRWLARDFGPKGVRVNAVAPGWVRTPLGDGGMAYLAEREGITREQAYQLATEHVPLRRPAEPAEIAAVCAFLASSDASIVTGHVLLADGGGATVDSSTMIFDPPAR